MDDPIDGDCRDPNDPAEVERKGRVAVHFGKDRDACPHPDGDPLRERWLTGWDAASKKKNRIDMAPARAEGWRAFQDGLLSHECRQGRTKEATDWHAGWEDAHRSKEKHDADRFR
jgi:ribosome modulation factor